MSIRNERTMKAAAGVDEKSGLVSLNVRQRCDEASEFEMELFQRIVRRMRLPLRSRKSIRSIWRS